MQHIEIIKTKYSTLVMNQYISLRLEYTFIAFDNLIVMFKSILIINNLVVYFCRRGFL